MPRHLRKRFPGAKYHVTNRGNGRQRVFFGEDDYERFLDQLTYALDADGVVLYAYCLMPNHFHLFVETPHGNIDTFMGRLSTAYGLYFRYKHSRPGHCFQGRYKAPLVKGDDYILRLTRYIHLNPVKTVSASRLSYQEKWSVLANYKWSSLAGYLARKRASDYIDYRWLELVGTGPLQRRRYRTYLAQMLSRDDPVLGESMLSSSYAIGDEPFREEVAQWAMEQSAALRVKADVAIPPQAGMDVDLIARVVADEFGFNVRDLRIPRKRLGHARGVFVELACNLARCSQRDVARYLGSVSEHAVGKARHKLRHSLDENRSLSRRLKKLELALKAQV